MISLFAMHCILAQDDTGSADPLAIIIGILVVICIGLCAALKSSHSVANSLGKDADRLTRRIYELEKELQLKAKQADIPTPVKAEIQQESVEEADENRKSYSGLTKAQQDYIDGLFARVVNPSAALLRQINELRAAKTETELREIFFRDSEVERPKHEAELLCAIMLAKQVKLKNDNHT